MSETEQPSAALPLATIEAIVRAANARTPLSPETMEGLRGWLSAALARAVKKAASGNTGSPLSKADVAQLENAHLRFAYFIDAFQNRDDPPPRLPTLENGLTLGNGGLLALPPSALVRDGPNGAIGA